MSHGEWLWYREASLISLSLTSHHEAWILTVHSLGVRDPWIRLSHGHIRSHSPHLCFLDEAWLKIFLRTEVCILIGVESLRRQSLRGQLPILLVLRAISSLHSHLEVCFPSQNVIPSSLSAVISTEIFIESSHILFFCFGSLFYSSWKSITAYFIHSSSLPPFFLFCCSPPFPFLFFSLCSFNILFKHLFNKGLNVPGMYLALVL